VGAAVAALTRVRAFALLLGAVFGALVTLQPVSDSDLFWHVATGARTLAGDLPRTDSFSWTIAGQPILTDQWLGDLILAAARALGDWRGILAVRAVAVASLVTIVVDTALAVRPGRPSVAIAAALPAIALSRFSWTDRPELLGLVCFALMVRMLRGGDRGLLWSLVLLFVWSQLHGSYALGLALILVSCGARAIEDGRERWRFLPIASFAVLATLLTPSGLAIWTSSSGQFLAPPRFVAEWGVPDPRTLHGTLFAITLALVVATAMTARRATLREAALIVPVAFVALTAERFTPLLAIVAAPYFASRWPDPLARWRSFFFDVRATGRLSPAVSSLGRASVVGLGVVVLALAILSADGRVDETGYPRAALSSLPGGPGVFNQYDWGGYLIYAAPRTPVFIDGRQYPYMPALLDDYRAIVGVHPGWSDIADRRGVRAMLVRPTDAIAVRAPERGWRVAYADAISVVLVR
jgi:hypothetical protein